MSETQVTERTSLASRVRAGVALLDREVPGWWAKVDVASLKLDDCTMCVLGQTFGSYYSGLESLPIEETGRESSSFGFTFTTLEDRRFTDWGTLNRLWSFVIRQRQRWVPVNAPTRYLLVPDEAHHLFALRPGGVVEHFDVCHGVWHPAPAEVLKDIAETFGDMTEVAYSDLPAVAQ